MQRALLAAGLLVAGTAHAATAPRACAPVAAARHDVVATLQALYAAARADDLAAFHAVTTPDFYAFDVGMTFAGDALMTLVAQAHAAGKRYEWHVEDPTVHVSCDTAWVTYVNRGWVQDASGRQDVTWLESATLAFDGGHWRIQFLHATRTPKPLPP